jgi:hypothetical protein
LVPDEGDAHVIATALRGEADVILTLNLKDFPAAVIEPLGLIALSPDKFLVQLFQINQRVITGLIREQSLKFSSPLISPIQLLEYISKFVPEFSRKAIVLLG